MRRPTPLSTIFSAASTSSTPAPVPFAIFDAHFHIVDRRFPLVANQGYLPDDYSCADYLARMYDYQLIGGAVVSGSFQAFDQSYLIAALERLGLSQAGFTTLLQLAERGVRVKATGFGRVDFAVRPALQALYQANPQALLFGSDLPCTRAPRPYTDADALLIVEALGEEGARQVFSENARSFYRGRTPGPRDDVSGENGVDGKMVNGY